jgi:haloacid dehalogenase superfamily, subfamily IA, variant 3 with third motif having DD or ED
MALRALLFDVDGTLAETERDGHRIAFNQAFAEAGLDWNWDEALYGRLLKVTGGRERITAYARDHHPDWLAKPDAEARVAALHQSKNAHYARRVQNGEMQLRSGLVDLLDAARAAGLRLAVVTTTSRANLDELLEATLDAPRRAAFELAIVGEDVAVKKPDPECYHLALQRLGVDAQETLAFEDSRNGLLSAMAAGIPTLIVRSFYFGHESFDGAVAVVDGFDGLDVEQLRTWASKVPAGQATA